MFCRHELAKIIFNKITIKIVYSKAFYNELMLIVNWFSFPSDFKRTMKLTDRTNYENNDANSPVPGTSF